MDVDLDELRHNLNKLKKGRYVNDQFKYAMQMKCVMTHDRRFHQLKSNCALLLFILNILLFYPRVDNHTNTIISLYSDSAPSSETLTLTLSTAGSTTRGRSRPSPSSSMKHRYEPTASTYKYSEILAKLLYHTSPFIYKLHIFVILISSN